MPDVPPLYTVAVGSNRSLGFELRVKGTRDNWNVSAASSIVMEWQMSGVTGVPQAPITLNSLDPNADWANGIVYVTVTPDDVTAQVQTVDFTLVTVIGGQTIAEPIGSIEVVPRPGYPEP
jgi:hypothetical protein